MTKMGIKTVPRPPYSPDLAPCDLSMEDAVKLSTQMMQLFSLFSCLCAIEHVMQKEDIIDWQDLALLKPFFMGQKR